MCGILGIYSKGIIDKKLFSKSLNSLKYRGPDETKKINKTNFAIGFNRLSIIGVNNNHSVQPIENKDYILTFNGEIYNYKDLAKKLNLNKCESKSDTFVLTKLIDKYGEIDFIKYVEGMFVISIYSKKNNKIYIYRDRIGERNIFFYADKVNFIFASEIRPLLKLKLIKKKINLNSIHEYFYHGMIFEDGQTIYQDIYQLNPGQFLIFDCNTFKTEKFFYYQIENERYNKKAIKKNIKNLLDEALGSRLISDVKIGILLSSGLDSSYMLSRLTKKFINKSEIFTASNKDKTKDESNQAKKTIKFINNIYPNKKLNHTIINNRKKLTITDQLISLSRNYDQPIHLSMSPLLNNICKFVKNKNYKVLYGGEGMDEIAYGYKRFFKTFEIINSVESSKIKTDHIYFGSGFKNITLINKIIERKINYRSLSSYKFIQKCLKKHPIYKTQMLFSIKYKLQTLLYRNDRIGMLNSIEMRCPFLKPKLMSAFLSLKKSSLFNMNLKKGKLILRNLSKNQIPKNLIEDKDKKGFVSDFENELNTKKFYLKIYKLVNLQNSFTNNYLSLKEVNKVIEKHYSKSEDFSYLIWRIFALEIWYKNFYKTY